MRGTFSTIRLNSSSRLPSRRCQSKLTSLPGSRTRGATLLCRRGSRSRYVSCPSDNLQAFLMAAMSGPAHARGVILESYRH